MLIDVYKSKWLNSNAKVIVRGSEEQNSCAKEKAWNDDGIVAMAELSKA